MKSVITEIVGERIRQIEKGFTAQHDDQHKDGELARAAACYAMREISGYHWPFEDRWKPEGQRENLIKAAAMIMAEIERIDRAANPKEIR